MVSVGVLLSFFYNVVVSWSIWYFFTSISSFPLDWSTCDHAYNTPNCFSKQQQDSRCSNGSAIFLFNNSCITAAQICEKASLEISTTGCTNGSDVIAPEALLDRKSTAVEEYWHKHVLGDAEQYNWDKFVRNEMLFCIFTVILK